MRVLWTLLGVSSLIGAAGINGRGGPSAADARAASALTDEPVAIRAPFKVGEKLEYAAKVNFVSAGHASMVVQGIDSVRGHETFHTSFDIAGRVLFFHVNDHYESWFDRTSLVSLHLEEHVDESKRKADKVYDFYPARRVYVRNGEENPSVSQPLDEGSFLYFLRALPLEVGKTYTFDRYYQTAKNPVVVTVDRREHIKLPAGEFDAIVLKPVIKSRGLFSESGQAEVWVSADSTHTLLKLKSKLPIGTLYLELKDIGHE
jgi:hypothetical protein